MNLMQPQDGIVEAPTVAMEYRNAAWGDDTKSWASCEVLLPGYSEWMPFNAMPTDPMEYGRLLFEAIRLELG
ncbi:hypothetical protein P2A10_08530 [Xanthomonas perforans]